MADKEEFLTFDIDTDQVLKKLENAEKEMPFTAKKMMKAVNSQVKKDIKKEAKARGYKSSNTEKHSYDTGYAKNLKSYENEDFSAAVLMHNNAYYYRFIEYGANIVPRNAEYLVFKIENAWYKVKSAKIVANPLIKPIADSYWRTNKGMDIMDEAFQKELDRLLS